MKIDKKKMSGKNGLKKKSTSLIGKRVTVGKHTVTVKRILQEGKRGTKVYLAKSSQKSYALKKIVVDAKDLKKATVEVEMMKTLTGHKNVIEYVDSSVSQTRKKKFDIMILMTRCKSDVFDVMSKKIHDRLEEDQILKIFCDVCEGLSSLHHRPKPIIHLDLKVENILFDDVGNYIICDMDSATDQDLALEVQGIRFLKKLVKNKVTPQYRAPEMADLFSGKRITTKADIWALGVLLFKMCFYAFPFNGSTLEELSAKVEIPETSKYSEGLHQLIHFVLQKDPDLRPDIYQVSHIAFALRGMKNPIQNFKNSATPKFSKSKQTFLIPTNASPLLKKKNCVEASLHGWTQNNGWKVVDEIPMDFNY